MARLAGVSHLSPTHFARAFKQAFGVPSLVLAVGDCRTLYQQLLAKGVEFTQEPIERYGNVDAGCRDPAGNGWKMIESKR